MSAQPGTKYDQGKPRASLVLGGFHRALLEVSKVGTFGANKYSDNGWKAVPNAHQRYSDAMLRHWLAEATEDIDSESGLSHAAHLAWNALARLELLLREGPNNNDQTIVPPQELGRSHYSE